MIAAKIPLWAGVVATLAAVVAGFIIGRPDPETDRPQPRTGVVTVVDLNEGGSVCISKPDGADNECYLAPGRGLRVGDKVRFVTEKVAADPSNSAAGNRSVLVYAVAER